jgi:hypothetical protein
MCAWQSHVSGGNPNFGARVAGSGGAQTGMFSSATAVMTNSFRRLAGLSFACDPGHGRRAECDGK